MRKAIFIFAAFTFLCSGCTNNVAVTKNDKSPSKISTTQQISPLEQNQIAEQIQQTQEKFNQAKLSQQQISANEITFELPAEIEDFSYASPDRLLEIMKKRGLAFEKGKEIVFPTAQESATEEKKDPNAIAQYNLNEEKYTLMNATSGLTENFTLKKGDENIFSSAMCYGAEGPIEDIRLVDESPAVTFVEACPQNQNVIVPTINIFYKGKTLNQTYKVDGSHYLFSYQGKLGFIAKENGKEFIYFDGKKVSSDYDGIITHSCCDSTRPLVKLYDNGILIFRALRGNNYYFTQLNLAAYL